MIEIHRLASLLDDLGGIVREQIRVGQIQPPVINWVKRSSLFGEQAGMIAASASSPTPAIIEADRLNMDSGL